MGAKKMSMHQTGFQEVLAMADLTGDLPEELALVGVQPELLDDFGGSLTDCVKAKIDAAIEAACAILDDWQIDYANRDSAPGKADLVGPGALEIKGYEQGRPTTNGDLP
jgi:hydrogenase maturation protease